MKFSILICTLTSRKEELDRLMSILKPQLVGQDVEVLVDEDEGQKSIGQKRNDLLKKATGDYIAFIDDDDLVSCDYVSKVMKALEHNVDVVGISLMHYEDFILRGLTYHSMEYDRWWELEEMVSGLMRYYRCPNHLNPVRREIALEAGFPEIDMGEDKSYSKKLFDLLNAKPPGRTIDIREPIYYYLFKPNK